MLLNELERSVYELLLAVSGPIADGMGGYIVDGDGNPISGPLPAVGVGTPPTFSIYKGESTAEIRLPCAIIMCDDGEIDHDTGNQYVDLAVETRVHANPIPGVIADPSAFAQAISFAIVNIMALSSIADEINVYAGDNLTVIGVESRAQRKRMVETALVHSVGIRLYCAGVNVR
jgi:hypothetical protein